MKINQLFGKVIPADVLLQLLDCYGLKGLDDRHTFKKQDLIHINTVKKLTNMKAVLEEYYLPCKAKLYLNDMTEKKSITILRQVLRLFDHQIISKERNLNTKKIIFYTITSDQEYENMMNMSTRKLPCTLTFD